MGAYDIDSDVPLSVQQIKRKVSKSVEVSDTSAANFWYAHASYWRERGNEAKAAECEANAKQYRGQ